MVVRGEWKTLDVVCRNVKSILVNQLGEVPPETGQTNERLATSQEMLVYTAISNDVAKNK